MAGAAEFREGIEEVIVGRHSRRGNEAAHGERIDERVIKMLIIIGKGSRNIAFAAVGLRRFDG